jgi:ribosomal protein S9
MTLELFIRSTNATTESTNQATRVRTVDEHGRATALGRRKTASARVWLSACEAGQFSQLSVNGRLWTEYFPCHEHRQLVRSS